MIEKHNLNLLDVPATMVIITVNIAVYIALNIIPNFADQLLLNPELSAIAQRPWTLVTVFFSHEAPIHLFGNMALFLFFGKQLEKIANPTFVGLTYLFSGFMGSLTFPLIAPIVGWSGPVVGASAAVFGIVSAYAVIQPNIRLLGSKVHQWAIGLFVFNGVWFIVNPEMSIGAAAHAVGLLVGLGCGYWLKRNQA